MRPPGSASGSLTPGGAEGAAKRNPEHFKTNAAQADGAGILADMTVRHTDVMAGCYFVPTSRRNSPPACPHPLANNASSSPFPMEPYYGRR